MALRKQDAFFEISLVEGLPFENEFFKFNVAKRRNGIDFLLILDFLLHIGDHLCVVVCLLEGLGTYLLVLESVSDVDRFASDWHAKISIRLRSLHLGLCFCLPGRI